MTARLSGGRFGPVYAGRDPGNGSSVVIRTFDDGMTVERQTALVDALTRLCERQLVHPSIARALVCGVEGAVPYVVHAALPGVPVDEYLTTNGPRPVSDVVMRVTQLAVAIDFADASGLHHGALGPRDIAFMPESSGISGFGLAQALRTAGVDTNEPSLVDDIYALGAMAFELLLGRRYDGRPIRTALSGLTEMSPARFEALAKALETALSPDMRLWPAAASEFAESLARAVPSATASTTLRTPAQPGDAGVTVGRLALGANDTRVATPRVALPRTDASQPPLVLTLFDPESPPDREVADPDPTLRTSVAIPSAAPAMFRADAEPAARDRRPLLRVLAVGGVAAAVLIGGLALRGSWFRSEPIVQPNAPEAARETVAAPEPPLDLTADAQAAPAASVEAHQIPAPTPAASIPKPDAAPVRNGAPSAPVEVTAASSPPRPKTGPASTPVTGRILVRSTPAGALVVVDGQPRGQTPLAIRDLDLGVHTVAVTGEGTSPWERRVALTVERPAQSFDVGTDNADGATEPAAQAGAGALQVDSRPPGAGVWLDGALAGKTPLSLSNVRPGSHDVRIELSGYRPWATSVALEAGARLRVAASLEP